VVVALAFAGTGALTPKDCIDDAIVRFKRER